MDDRASDLAKTAVAARASRGRAPKLYYVHPLWIGALPDWSAPIERCRTFGFDHLCTAPLFAPGPAGDLFLTGDVEAAHPILDVPGPADDVIAQLASMCAAGGVRLVLDVALDRVDRGGRTANLEGAMFWASPPAALHLPPDTAVAYARWDDAPIAEGLAKFWIARLSRLLDAGAAGFRFLWPQSLSATLWREINRGLHSARSDCISLGWTPGARWAQLAALVDAGFDGVFPSLPWWDRRANWFVEECNILRHIAPLIGCPEAPFEDRFAPSIGGAADVAASYAAALRLAAAIGSGLLVPMGFEVGSRKRMETRRSLPIDACASVRGHAIDLGDDLRAANRIVDQLGSAGTGHEYRSLTESGDAVTAILRADARDVRQARTATVVVINPAATAAESAGIPLDPLSHLAGAAFGEAVVLSGPSDPAKALAPREVRILRVTRRPDAIPPSSVAASLEMAPGARIAIESITPSVDAGRFAAKRIVGETVTVEADVFSDGHDIIEVALLWRAIDERDWRCVSMGALGNDRWRGEFVPARVGVHLYTIEAWIDDFRSQARELEIKFAAGNDIALDIADIGRLLDDATAAATGALAEALAAARERLRGAAPARAVELVGKPAIRKAMARAGARRCRVRHEPALRLEVDRPQAAFGAWYELFPRSAGALPGRHGTFDDVIARLPSIRDMGFDVLYLPPIHPIGRTNRKGRNNSLVARSDDPGSPYAIGSEQGGHDATHPALGTLDDFLRLQHAALAHGMEIALDFAVQCSPDHPWVTTHPNWFRRRADGSIKFAENPPKKYEDIVNVDFYAPAAVPELWTALRDVVLFWVRNGVRIFRVDNPHTKPLPFWEWLIADVRSRHPDVLFLAEAFTRPKMMYRLAKIGFSQSYTYFTWRNSKRELTEYLTELTTGAARDFFRPNFFVNTPDINPFFLQNSGRAGFVIRAALAATLSGLWGMYSGFELCEAAALPDREEYIGSEKYELKHRDYAAPGNIIAEISRLNRIRRSHPVLHGLGGLQFYAAANDAILYYGRRRPPHRDMVLVAVNLDPHHAQEATIEVPLWEWGIPDNGSIAVEDLMRERHFVWTGKLQTVRLDPSDLPFAIWRIGPLP
jgi:starch synthase (maltosyl-transferring)